MTATSDTKGHFIAGELVTGTAFADSVNPSDTSDIVGRYARGDASTASAALDAAHHAFGSWSTSPVQKRFDVLDATGSRIAQRADELARLLAREEGKPLGEAKGEVLRAAQLFKFFAGEAIRNSGEILESTRPGLTVEMTHEPVGVIGAITPWNFPIAIPAWKIAPALAYGNTVIIKPAEIAPGCTWELASMLTEAGLPPGVLNVVMGRGSEVGAALLDSGRLDAVSFTGSVATGQRIAVQAAEKGVRVQCEMGGKNPMVVLDDADLPTAVEAVVNGSFFSTGQRCTASSRVIVTEGIHDAFVEALTNRLPELKVGHALAEDTIIGPVVSKEQLEKDVRYLKDAKAEGAEVISAEPVEQETEGYFLSPAIVLDPGQKHTISREEVFGPIASVVRAEDYDHALNLANDTEFGLSAGICTTSLTYATHFKRHSQAGMVMVNAPTAGVDYHVSFGGRRGSSYGHREQGRAAREFYTLHKTAYTNAG
jgi:aldehyde dehydrogenase (NAD+)